MQKYAKTAETQASRAPQAKVDIEVKKRPPKRTAGLWLMDMIIYPLNNVLVFGMSVFATYMTTHGKSLGEHAPGWVRWTGEKLQQRGDNFTNMLTESKVLKMSKSQAEVAKMVFFSFLDGTLVAPVVKLLEDRREKIAKRIDAMLGTKPEDESVYMAEPKQSWKSVILGRAATAAVVVPTAILLDNFPSKDRNINDIVFNEKGKAWGEKLKEKVADKKTGKTWGEKFPSIKIPELVGIGVFETFYTTVCTVGLYFSSRMIARRDERKKEHREKVQEKYHKEQAQEAKVELKIEKPSKAVEKDLKSEAVGNHPAQADEKDEESKVKTAHAEKYKQVQELEPSLAVGV